MLPHERRVVVEKAELDEKLEKLADFTDTGTYSSLPALERERLATQLHLMLQYSAILGARIGAFNQ